MGRHAATPEPEPEAAHAGTPPEPAGQPAHPLIERLALAGAAAGGTGAVMAWAGAAPIAYLLGAAGIGGAVLVAARLAGSPPGAPRTRADGHPHREP